jgi:hypothetical protein
MLMQQPRPQPWLHQACHKKYFQGWLLQKVQALGSPTQFGLSTIPGVMFLYQHYPATLALKFFAMNIVRLKNYSIHYIKKYETLFVIASILLHIEMPGRQLAAALTTMQ